MSIKAPNNSLRISFLVNRMMFKEDGTPCLRKTETRAPKPF